MEWLALLLKLGHVLVAFALVAGMVGRWILLTRASRTDDVEHAHLLAEAASPFERAVQVSGTAIVVLGLLTAWAQDYPWLGLTTGWMLLSVLLIVPMLVLVPLVFIPRGRAFASAMDDARAGGQVTEDLRAAWGDRAVALARRYELAAVTIIVVLMVLKPF